LEPAGPSSRIAQARAPSRLPKVRMAAMRAHRLPPSFCCWQEGHDPLEPLFGPPRFARRGWSRSAEPFGQTVVQKAAATLAILTDDRCSDCRAVLVSGVRSPACRTTAAIDMRALDRHHDAAVTRLIPDCPVARAGRTHRLPSWYELSRTRLTDEMRKEQRRRVLGE
jgi:hypothetical protein